MSLTRVSIVQTRSLEPGDLALTMDGPTVVSCVQTMSEVSADVELRDCAGHVDIVAVRSVKAMIVLLARAG